MLVLSTLKSVIDAQRKSLLERDEGLTRALSWSIPVTASHALIVSGVRRCGKSTLLWQLLKPNLSEAIYLNFEDTRLYDFERSDFSRLDQAIDELGASMLFFDEIQIVPEWERYVRQKLDEGFKIVITGSNASLLSKELGTKLTGRHITKELFPFSFDEFCQFRQADKSAAAMDYLETGGFPEFVKQGSDAILNQLFDDILVRDIAVRYGVRDVKTLQKLAQYLVSNVGKLITGNRLKGLFEMGATSTVMEYLAFLEDAWLFQYVPKFSYSLKKQLVNPRKVYAIDTGLVSTNSGSFSGDKGRKFENLVYLALRRKFTDIHYFSEKKECDFIVSDKGRVLQVVQACFELNEDNLSREVDGIMEALNFFSMEKGTIVTLSQRDRFERDGKIIDMVPFHEYT